VPCSWQVEGCLVVAAWRGRTKWRRVMTDELRKEKDVSMRDILEKEKLNEWWYSYFLALCCPTWRIPVGANSSFCLIAICQSFS
jgi:hypothetical protein